MARFKSKNEEIIGKLDPKYWVQKCDPLVLMRSVPFSLGELKILDTYISRINATDDTRRTVIFTKEEYEELMGLTSANYRALAKHTEGLLGKVVTLEMPDKAFLKFVLFTKAYYHKDEYGKPIIEITCTEEARDLFFCIGKYHYFSYALENVINLTRKASYLLYLHILTNRFRGEWELSLEELRDEVLDYKEQESYQEYKIFKNRVLDPAVKEVNKKTDCHFEYEAVKRGRRVVKIKFIYHSHSAEITFDTESFKEPVQLPICDFNSMNELSYYAQALKNSLNVDDLKQILAMLDILHPEYDSGQKYSYLSYLWSKVQHYDNKKSINDKAAYIKSMLENEMKTSKKTEKSQNDNSSNVDKYKQLINKF